MRRALLTALVALLVTPFAAAHFVFVVLDKDGKALKVILSDDLEPDANVPVDKLVGIKLTAVSADGKTAAVECKKAEACLTAALPPNTAVMYGSVTYGMLTREGAKPALLVYHPKVVTAGTTGKAATVGDKTPIEAVPVTAGGKTKFQLLLAGKPVADAEGSLIKPDGSKEKVKTDKDGFTASFDATGRYALWLRHVEAKGGEHDGKKFEETRHYATLVVDVK